MKLPVCFVLMALFTIVACKRQSGSEKAEDALTDSLIRSYAPGFFSNPQQTDSALQRLQSSLTDSINIYKTALYRATCRRAMGDTSYADSIYKVVEKWAQNHKGRELLLGLVWNHRGVNAAVLDHYDEAYTYYLKAYTYLNRPPKTTYLISTCINLASICQYNGKMYGAADYYHQALFLCDSLNDRDSYVSACTGLGQVYVELGHYDEAHRYFSIAGKTIERQDLFMRCFYHLSLGNCYYFEEKYPEAIASFERALEYAKKQHNDILIFKCEANLGEVYLMCDRRDKAAEHLGVARSLYASNPALRVGDLQFYIRSLMANLALAKGEFAKAREIVDNDTMMAANCTPRYMMLHYRRLKHYAEKAGKWQRAYRYQTLEALYADSLANEQVQNHAAHLANIYKRDTTVLRQRLALADYTTRNARQKNYIYGFLLMILGIAVTATIYLLVHRRKEQKRHRIQVAKTTQLRMDIVRNRVSPHYIFNVLGTILPKLQKYTALALPVEMLIDVLRGNLLLGNKLAVALKDEIALVRQFVNLHHYSYEERPQVIWHVAPEVEKSEYPVLGMSLQILVENALKHAFVKVDDESAVHIYISIDEAESNITMQVVDNGRGYHPEKVVRTGRDTGTGLSLITRTIEIMNPYNEHPARFMIDNIEPPGHGTSMRLIFPTDYRFEPDIEAQG